MNKSDLIEAIAARSDLSKVAAGRALDSVVAVITEAVAAGDTVALVGFGSFKPAPRAAREGKNPKTGEKLQIPATTLPKFSAGASFKAAVSSSKVFAAKGKAAPAAKAKAPVAKAPAAKAKAKK